MGRKISKFDPTVQARIMHKAIKIANGDLALAKKLGVTKGRISQWKNGHTGISFERAIQIAFTIGDLGVAFSLRPELKKFVDSLNKLNNNGRIGG